ncbi:MAG: hypothetical protein A3F13_00480 [Gammaproteobacteria bacterium RIFCSPHIGHO2_12_FULL_40_19]|nr:MAG: hypothetical protein A3F13_00480 [Gammaproteobacteria bacterium RIFCSPHIGHO2_12_FULL_40_19]
MNWILFFSTHTTLALIFTFIFCAIIGSFLNVVIYRYPLMLQEEWKQECLMQLALPLPEKSPTFNICLPRSHCCHCKKLLPFWLNIPIVSYLILRGKCHYCKTHISIQYFLVEVLTPLLSILVISKLGFTLSALAVIILTWGLITLSFIDFNNQFLPDTITYTLLWLGLIISTKCLFVSSIHAIFGAVIGYLFLWSIAKFYILIRNKEGMGLGDCKMLAMIGAWVGLISLVNVLIFSTLLALIVGIILLAYKKIERANPIPFGPYIAIAGWCTVLYGDQLTQWIVRWVS